MVRVFREHHMEVYDKVMRRFRSELGLTEEEYKQKSLLLEILEFERKHVRRTATLKYVLNLTARRYVILFHSFLY